jgi:chromosomal replication initiation ATPase DnaA
LLMHLLADRQLAVPETVQEWMLRRLPRSPAALRTAVALLDRASLERGRTVTTSFAAQVLLGHKAAPVDLLEEEVSVASELTPSQTAGLL